jgi:pyruvate-ferredoxin/flavodoxin oxidoreductase
MDEFARIVGREYHLFEYVGAPDADRVIVLMGSGCETAHETVEFLNWCAQGEKVGVVKVRLYRPFDARRFVEALPGSVKSHCGIGPHQGTGGCRGTAVVGLHCGGA